jgi:hypothetical protein
MAATVSSTAPSVDELIRVIARVATERFRESRLPTNGAYLAELIRREFPTFSYKQVGLTKLSEAVAMAERQGLVTRNRAVKHLEVFPRSATFASEGSQPVNQPSPPHIRPDIWRAFVYVAQEEACFFDRESRDIVTASQVGPTPDESRYVKTEVIPLSVQQEWMREFVRARTQLDINEAPIHDQYCFVKFPLWLRSHEPGLDMTWKQYRVRRIAEFIRTWADRNSLDSSGFFSAPSAYMREKGSAAERSFSPDERVIRAAIIMAAKELPIENLKDIAVPIRYVLRALQTP